MKLNNLILWYSSNRDFDTGTYAHIGITENLYANIADAGYTEPEDIINVKTIAGRTIKITKARRYVELSIPIFYNKINSGLDFKIEAFVHAPYKRIFITATDFPGQSILASFITDNTINLTTDSRDVEYFNDVRKDRIYKIKLLEEESTYNIL